MLIYTFINGSDWLCLKFDFWRLCRTAYLDYSMPVFSIAVGIYSFLTVHTAKVRLKTFILQVHKNNFFFSALGRCKFVPFLSTESTAMYPFFFFIALFHTHMTSLWRKIQYENHSQNGMFLLAWLYLFVRWRECKSLCD